MDSYSYNRINTSYNMINSCADIEIDSWSKLSNIAEVFFNITSDEKREYIFRGQPNSTDKLIPSVGRKNVCDTEKTYCPKREKDAFDAFKRAALPYVGYVNLNDWAWLALAQHHGMQTRLLDWSKSLFNAAYFAIFRKVNNACDVCSTNIDDVGSHAVIFYVSGLPTVNCEDCPDPFLIDEVKMFYPPHISPRIPAQNALFTVHPRPQDEFLVKKKLGKILIKRQACFTIKRVLNSIGINEASLFPGLDGLSRHLGWEYKEIKD